MGQKVNPVGIRLGVVQDWASRWYARSKNYAGFLRLDTKVREFIREKLNKAGVSRIEIERSGKNVKVTVYAARPGVVFGRSGKEIETLRDQVAAILGATVHISIKEIAKPELDSALVAQAIAQQLERRVMFRRAMKKAVTTTMRSGALGIKVSISGRLGGAEIARTEWYREGRVPLHTFRADIDYALAEAYTTYGIIGVKVWIFKGEILGDKQPQAESNEKQTARVEK